MIRRPLWLGTGIAIGVGGTLWAEQRVRRRVRRAAELLSPAVAKSEALQAARHVGGRLRDAADAARAERYRHEVELWRRMGEVPPEHAHPRVVTSHGSPATSPPPRGSRQRQHR